MNLAEQARLAARTYVEAINGKQLEVLLDLFAGDGTLEHPFGHFAGRKALSDFYGGLVMLADTQLSIRSELAEGQACAVEVVAISPQAPDKPQYALDLFEVNAAGKVQRLSIYYRNFDLK